MRRSWTIALTSVLLAGGTLAAAVTTASSAPAAATGPVITSVVFTGSAAAPTVTIVGTGFGKVAPPHDPSTRPAKHLICTSKAPTGNFARFGWDYGNKLFLADQSKPAYWTAGRYRTQPFEADCIGLIVSTYSPTKIVYTLGKAYPHYPGASARYNLAAGNTVEVAVKSARYVTKVKYHTVAAKKSHK